MGLSRAVVVRYFVSMRTFQWFDYIGYAGVAKIFIRKKNSMVENNNYLKTKATFNFCILQIWIKNLDLVV